MPTAKLNEDMERLKTDMIRVMLNHIGKNRAISMARLHDLVVQTPWDDKINDTRKLRRVITALRQEGVAICSSAGRTGGGYFISSAGSELAEYLGCLRSRALGILRREAMLRKTTLPELAGQIALELSEKEGE